MNTEIEIVSRVKTAIQKCGLKQYVVAEKIGVEPGTFSSYMNGRRNIPEENLKKIAEITNVSVQWLLTGTDAVPPEEKLVIKEQSMFYPSNTSNPPAIQFTEKQLIEILKLKDTNPLTYKIIEMIMRRNDQLAALVEKLQKQNEVIKQD